MLHELQYTSPIFKKEISVRCEGDIVIELQNDEQIRGNVPITSAIPDILTYAEALIIKDEITLRLAEVKGWNIRRLLSKPFEDGDRKMQFRYILSDQLLKSTIEAGEFTPIYLKDLDTSDLRG